MNEPRYLTPAERSFLARLGQATTMGEFRLLATEASHMSDARRAPMLLAVAGATQFQAAYDALAVSL